MAHFFFFFFFFFFFAGLGVKFKDFRVLVVSLV